MTRAPDGERWTRVVALFEQAVELPPEDRDAWLLDGTADDPELAETVRRMLSADSVAGDLLGAGVAAAAHLALEPEIILEPGARVGAFDIIGELDRGGMGVVYAAKDRHLDRPVALKFVQAAVSDGRAAAERVMAEARAASALDHPNVSTVYQVGESGDGRYFIAMPRYEGETLQARLERGPLPPATAREIARQVAAGLAAAHRAGIVHRDVTPANIFLTSEGPVKLLDFGIAALAGAGHGSGHAGTIGYVSPEQARGAATDARTDVWSLGVVIFRMLMGELPFAGGSAAEVLARVRGPEPAPRLAGRRGIPKRLARVVDRALHKDAASRYEDAGEMLRALTQAQPGRTKAAVSVMLVAIALIAVARLGGRGDAARASWLSRAPGERTLAILPAVPATGDSAAAYLTVGMMDELTARLAGLRRVRVKGPRSVAGSGVSVDSAPSAIGRVLGVDYFVQSRFQLADSLIVVSLRLVDAREGFQLWADEYTGAKGGLLELQDSIARDVAMAVAGELGAEERAVIGARITASPAAYDHFLRANYLLGKRTPASIVEAAREYSLAAESDRSFAEAFAGHAYALLLFIDWGWPYPGRTDAELLTAARNLIDRAIELDPGSAKVWLSRAYLLMVSDPFRHEGAVPAFERSLQLDSLDPEAFHQYGQTLMQLGRWEEAGDAYRRALALDPARPMTLVPLSAIAMKSGNARDAVRWADSAVAVTRDVPAPYALAVSANIALRLGDARTALRDARRALDLDRSYPPPALSVLAVSLARLDEPERARAALERLMESVDAEKPTPTDVRFAASALFALGRKNDALTLIERALPRGAQLWFYLQSADFDPYRDDPRFSAVEREADPR